MTTVENLMTAYENHAKALKEANAQNKATVFDALREAGITRVAVTFDGEGDSGQIEELTAFAQDKPQPVPSETVPVQHATWDGRGSTRVETPLREAIEELCYGLLSEQYDGWENNDGAFGEFTFHVQDRTIALKFNGRYTDVHTTTHMF